MLRRRRFAVRISNGRERGLGLRNELGRVSSIAKRYQVHEAGPTPAWRLYIPTGGPFPAHVLQTAEPAHATDMYAKVRIFLMPSINLNLK